MYSDLASAATALEASVDRVVADPSAANVAAARAEWRAMRQPWERSEAFLNGPVATAGYDPRLDSWPLDVTELERVLASNDSLNQTTVDELDNNLRGYHTVEFLLWSDGDANSAAAMTPAGEDPARAVARVPQRQPLRRAYLEETATDLRQTAAALAQAWHPDGGDFASQVASAGADENRVYASQRAAMQEIIQGMATIAGEVANAQMGDPLKAGDIDIVESKHRFNSRSDYTDNIRGIQHIYLGEYPS